MKNVIINQKRPLETHFEQSTIKSFFITALEDACRWLLSCVGEVSSSLLLCEKLTARHFIIIDYLGEYLGAPCAKHKSVEEADNRLLIIMRKANAKK
jgi:hypothetical protein